MKLILNAGNSGAPMGRVLLNEIKSFGFDGVRVDIPDNHEAATAVLNELKPKPGSPSAMGGVDFFGYVDPYPIFLIAGGHMLRDDRSPFSSEELIAHTRDCCVKMRDLGYFKVRAVQQPAIEIGNEPDLAHHHWKENPGLLARTFTDCYEVVREFSQVCPVLSPSVSNLNRRGFSYLERMLAVGFPSGSGVAFHRYPHDGEPTKPHDGFDNRDDEASHLVELAEGRDLWCTETGLSEGPHDGTFYTEEFVADAYADEVAYWNRVPSMRALTWYQINDGPNPNEQLHHYGIRRIDSTWKPVARRVESVKEQMA